jgi:hypothetical protein
MTADCYNSEGLEGAVFGCEEICPKVKVVLPFRVAWDTALLNELPFGQPLIHDSGPFQN